MADEITSWDIYHTFDYEFFGGYKYFFTEKLGARFYGNLHFMHHSQRGDELIILYTATTNITSINYTINADFLWNFYNGGGVEMGVFTGLGLGGTSKVYDYPWLGEYPKMKTISAFDFGANFGLRGSFSDNHSVELAVRVPFLAFDETQSLSEKTINRHAFSMSMRYAYTFGAQKPTKKIKRQPKQTIKPSKKQSTTQDYDEFDLDNYEY
ncbi:outer membrane beta-barrel protein [Helicobacter sp. 23-1045]